MQDRLSFNSLKAVPPRFRMAEATEVVMTPKTNLVGFDPDKARIILTAVRHAADGLITQGEMLKAIAKAAEVEHFWDAEGNPLPLE